MGSKSRLFIILFLGGVLFGAAVILLFTNNKTPNKAIKAGSLVTETITRGDVISSITVSGTVESGSEVLLNSPARTIVNTVFKAPGSWVEKGELILALDEKNTKDEIKHISSQLEMKKNSLEKNRLNAQSALLDLGYNEEVKKLRITSLKSTLADQQKLLKSGGISPARIEKTKQEIVLAEKDLEKLSGKNSIRIKQLAADEKGLLLQIKDQNKTLKEKQEILKQLQIKAPNAGIILAAVQDKGLRVERDKMLVRMSDLSSFKVIGSIDKRFAKQLKTGTPVSVKIENEELEGRIGDILPNEENKQIEFHVYLKEKNHPKLKATKNAEIHIKGKCENVLRIKKNSDLEFAPHHVFVLKEKVAVKTPITFGMIGQDFCEIVSGVNEGDKIIVEGIDAKDLDRIEIK